MRVKDGTVILAGIHPLIRQAMKKAERIWIELGRPEGITVTAGLDGVHSAGSWHYCGCAVDLRTHYWDDETEQKAADLLKAALPGYDIVNHGTHIHVEIGDDLARKHGLLL